MIAQAMMDAEYQIEDDNQHFGIQNDESAENEEETKTTKNEVAANDSSIMMIQKHIEPS